MPAEPTLHASNTLEQAEDCVRRAAEILTRRGHEDLSQCEAELESAAAHLSKLSAAYGGPAPGRDVLSRLESLRTNLVTLQVMAKRATAFYRAFEQLDPAAAVGYTPRGLERAL